MASIVIKARQSGPKYYIAYRITDADGKRHQKWVPCKSKQEARLLLDEVTEAERENKVYTVLPERLMGQVDMHTTFTVSEMVEHYIDYCCKTGRWEARTLRNVEMINRNYIAPYIGEYLINSITTRELQHYYNHLPEHKAARGNHTSEPSNISARTVREVHKILRPAFKLMTTWGEISSNPANDLELPKTVPFVREQLQETEIKDMLATCEDEEQELMMGIMFACTLRCGELAGLTWDCVDLSAESIANNAASIYVNKELARLNRNEIARTGTRVYITFPSFKADAKSVKVLKYPKTTSSVRRNYLPTSLAQKLIEYKTKQKAMMERLGEQYHDYQLVFAQTNGYPLSNEVLSKRFKRFLETKGIRPVDFYSLRHSGATAKLRATGNIKAVQGDMGHSTTDMLLNVYAGIREEDRQLNAQVLESTIFGENTKDSMQRIEASALNGQDERDT